MTKKERIIIPIIGVVLLGIFAFTDLQISQALYHVNAFGIIFEVLGELPFTFMALLATIILFKNRTRKNKFLSVLAALGCAFLAFNFAFMSGFMTTNYLNHHLSNELPGFTSVIVGAIMLVLAVLLAKQIPEDKAYEAMSFAILAIFYMITVLVVMNVLKGFWGRMRIREMTDMVAEFTPWYVITNRGGFDNRYASFPSGHAMNATGIILLTLLPTFLPKLNGKEKLLRTVSYLWIVIVSVSRVCMGAHFSSDVTAGALISIFLFDLLHTLIYRKRNKAEKAVLTSV